MLPNSTANRGVSGSIAQASRAARAPTTFVSYTCVKSLAGVSTDRRSRSTPAPYTRPSMRPCSSKHLVTSSRTACASQVSTAWYATRQPCARSTFSVAWIS